LRSLFKTGALVAGASGRFFAASRPWLDVRALDIPLTTLDPAFDGYRIVHFSDLHFDGIVTTPKRLAELVEVINVQQPDLIAFTGDFVTYGVAFQPQDLIEPLRGLRARDGVVAVRGNHDCHRNAVSIRRVIAESGMIELNNAVHRVSRGSASLYVAGLDSTTRGKPDLHRVLAELPAGAAAILLVHEPDYALVSAATHRFGLQLSGHLHGGQIRLPLLTRLMLGTNYRFLNALSTVDTMQLYINRGIGMVSVPLRINSPSELTVITLRKRI
jgi:predicted MPP superfamily phosphohydrolase